MYNETELLVPDIPCWLAIISVYFRSGGNSVPFWGLAASNVGCSLLGLFPQTSGTIRILLANGFAIGQVLGSVDHCNDGADFRTIHGEVGEDAGRMHPILKERLWFHGHGDRSSSDSSSRVGFTTAGGQWTGKKREVAVTLELKVMAALEGVLDPEISSRRRDLLM